MSWLQARARRFALPPTQRANEGTYSVRLLILSLIFVSWLFYKRETRMGCVGRFACPTMGFFPPVLFDVSNCKSKERISTSDL